MRDKIQILGTPTHDRFVIRAGLDNPAGEVKGFYDWRVGTGGFAGGATSHAIDTDGPEIA